MIVKSIKQVVLIIFLIIYGFTIPTLGFLDMYPSSFNTETQANESDLPEIPETRKTIKLKSYSQSEIDGMSSVSSFISRGPIIISGNAGFIDCGCVYQGDGSSTHPYIIQNYFIDGSSTSGITISNTDKYFVIRNVWITNANYYGFYLDNARNGLLINNTATDNSRYGFYLPNSEYLNLTNNYVANNQVGIALYGCTYITLEGNIVINNPYDGIALFSNSYYNSIHNNTAISNQYGFYCDNVRNNVFFNNSAFENTHGFYFINDFSYNNLISNVAMDNEFGFNFDASTYYMMLNNITKNIANNNLVGFYLTNTYVQDNNFKNNTASNNNIGFESHGFLNTFENNSANGNQYGYYIFDGSGNIFDNNEASNNIQSGFHVISQKNIFLNNIASNNLIGFSIGEDRNNLTANVANDNSYYGFYVVSDLTSLVYNIASENTIFGFYLYQGAINNDLINNTANHNRIGFRFYSSSSNNLINSIASNNSQYGIGLTAGSGNIIVQNILFNNLLGDCYDNSSLNIWSGNTYQSFQGEEVYVIPGTAGSIDNSPKILDQDLDLMPDWWENLYNLNPLVNDSVLDYDHDGYTNLQEYVAGTDPNVPNWYPSPVFIQSTIFNSEITWVITSANPSTYLLYLDGNLVANDKWISGENITYSLIALQPNVYNFTIIAFDIYGFSTSHIDIITINPTSDSNTTAITITITIPESVASSHGSNVTQTTVKTQTTIETIISQISTTLSKTAQGFEIVIMILGFLGVLVIRKKKQIK